MGAMNADLYGVEQYRDFRGAADRTLKKSILDHAQCNYLAA